ncbi:hypothetical protein [Deinococcus apachensis]|uniref:hypothetical protein n=1 Tax=Deinococcus apachensis TaxID=309886 RepID=UPI00036F6B71|nr:hypothetical protein [Deinococcus apachensis]
MAVPELTYVNLRDPATWRDLSFELRDQAGNSLFALPPTVGLREEMGDSDPYTWQRSPGSGKFFPLGDGLPTTRPTTLLTGQYAYPTVDLALSHTATIHERMPLARSLYWRGLFISALDATWPGSALIASRDRLTVTSFNVTLNTVTRLTRANLAASADYPLGKFRITGQGPGYALVEPLDGVTVTQGTLVLEGPDGQTFPFNTLEANGG